MFDTLIAHGTIITMDDDRQIIEDGAVGIASGEIAYVGPWRDDLADANDVIDATGRIVMPGIVDTHGHAGHSLTRGLGEGLDDGGWMDTVETLYFRASTENFWAAES